nr:DNA primase [Desulfobulbaceae bacterium]
MSLLYGDEVVQDVKNAADIVEIIGESVSLKKTGINYKGLCPFHSEKTPSFTVNQVRRSFHCFGCGEGGDVIAFIMRSFNLNFVEALKQLADRYHISLPEKVLSQKEQESGNKRKILYEINQKAVDLFHTYLLTNSDAAPARKYLKERRIPPEVVEAFKLGFAPNRWDFILKQLGREHNTEDLQEAGLIIPKKTDGFYDRFRNRVLFPIFSHNGKAIGFSGRDLGDQGPKYLNSPETPVFNKSRNLFGLYQTKDAIRETKRCLVVEGNFDLIALFAAGIKEVVAPLGTALTNQHVKAMKGFAQEAILLFDGDRAGIKAAMRSVPLFLAEKMPAKVTTLPYDYDPDTFIEKFGVEKLAEALKAADSLPEFVFDKLVDQHGLSLEGKGMILEELRPVIAAIPDHDLQRTLFIAHFSQKLGLSPEQMSVGITPNIPQWQQYEPAQAPVGHPKLQLTKTEENLLSFLIIYPEFINKFIEAGLHDALNNPSAQVIAQHIEELNNHKVSYGPERLLELTVGPERSFISKQLTTVPDIDDYEKEAVEKINWLKENSTKIKMHSLTAAINEAQRRNDTELLMKLLDKKRQLSEKIE